MADKKISQLTLLAGADIADNDLVVVVDTSGVETKAVRFDQFYSRFYADVQAFIDVDLEAYVTAAETAQTGAEAAEANVIDLFNQFGDQYLGAKTSDPTVDNDGDPLTEGDIYFNTTDSVLKFYSGSAWVAPEVVATTAASNALTSETNAASSASAAATSETNASNSAVAAATSASNAATSETNAASSASSASSSAANASTSETNAGTYASNASASASSAASSESNASASETNAAASESSASTSATAAAGSATAAATSATDAAGSATNAASSASSALESKDAASVSETNAANSATSASNSATAAATSEGNAATSETNAASSATAAAASATAAAASETAAAASETAAAASESAAAASESAAATSETNAATSESNAASSASDAATSATAASGSATAAAGSATAAAGSATDAATSETNAAASATAASASETSAANSESVAILNATSATASAAAAYTSEQNAATSESNAATSATNAATSATSASNSATAAASSASAASASADAALAALDSFDDRYLGQKASDPSVDNDGNPLVAGALYFNTTEDIMKVFDGSIWVAAYSSLSGAMFSSNNLSDVADVVASRANLGLGTAATTASTDYATAIHTHTKSDITDFSDADYATAIHTHTKSDITDFSDADYATAIHTHTKSDITDFSDGDYATAIHTHTKSDITDFSDGDYATAAQGTLADSAIQPADLATVATTGAYSDLSGLPTLGTAAATSSTDYATASHTHTLSDITDAGTAAAANTTDFATAAQGALADSAIQPADLATVATTGAYSDLTGLPTLGTAAATDSTAYATAAQGALADSALQSGDNISSLTNDSGYISSNQTITLSGDVSGSGTTSIVVTVADDSHNHVISNVDGLQTALDAKLESSSYTASDVLTKIKTVDGSGSGLDADLLDGLHSSAFASSAQGALADTAVQPADLATVATTGDYNDLTNTPAPFDPNTLATVATTGDYTDLINIPANIVTDAAYVHTDNNYTTSEQSKLAGIEAGATADQTITAGSGLTGGGTGDVTLSHADTSEQASVNNSGATVIQGVTLDTYGHVTGLSSKTLTAADVGALASGAKAADSELLDGIDSSAFVQNNNGDQSIAGNLTVGSGTSSSIYMVDSDNGNRAIHNNSNRFGFLKQDLGWGAYCDDDGNWTAVGNVTAYSDERLKSNIQTIENAVDTVKALRGVTFEKDGKASLGVIAQEVQKVLPELVHEDEEYLSVAYGNMVGVLIEAIKEQQAQIDELKARLEV